MTERAMESKSLFEDAKRAMDCSYSPYSKFKVGAALLTKGAKVYTGTNIENASYGLTICAERVAMFKAIAAGEKEFEILVIVVNGKPVAPCGACRQVLYEFAPELEIICLSANDKGESFMSHLNDLLPKAFKL